MKKKEKISIVIATYNGAKYIGEQLQSILKQTIAPDEIIICDDHSVDGTVEIVQNILNETKQKYSLILHEQNEGVVKSFWDGLRNCSGDIVFFSDQDDYWLCKKVEMFIKVFYNHPEVGLVFSDAFITDKNLKPSKKTLWNEIGYLNFIADSSILEKEMIKRNIFTGMCLAFRKEIIPDDLCIPRHMLHDEYIGWLAVCTSSVFGIKTPLVYYRQHGNNVKGASKTRKLGKINSSLFQILRSSNRYVKKYDEIKNNIDISYCVGKMLEEAGDFYGWRKKELEQCRFKSFADIISRIKKGEYKKFGSKSDCNLLKDILLLIYKNKAFMILQKNNGFKSD